MLAPFRLEHCLVFYFAAMAIQIAPEQWPGNACVMPIKKVNSKSPLDQHLNLP